MIVLKRMPSKCKAALPGHGCRGQAQEDPIAAAAESRAEFRKTRSLIQLFRASTGSRRSLFCLHRSEQLGDPDAQWRDPAVVRPCGAGRRLCGDRARLAPAAAKAVIDADRRRSTKGPCAADAVVARHSSDLGAL